jgi:hypothetical protein
MKKMKKIILLKRLSLFLVAVVLMTSYLTGTHAPKAHAAGTPFTKAFLRLDNLTATTFTTARVCFQPTVTTAIHTIVVQFPTTASTDYVIDATTTDWNMNTSNLDSGQTAVANLPANPTISGKVVTVTLSSDLTPVITNLYCFNFVKNAGTGIIKTSSAGAAETTQGYIQTNTSVPAVINQTTYSYSGAIITNNQVVVNAVVPPSFTFVLSGNTDTFASVLSTASVNTSPGNTITLTTNAASGWIVWADDTNFKTVTDAGSNPANEHGALKSATASNYTLSNNTVSTLGTAAHNFSTNLTVAEDYGLQAHITTDAAGGGTVALDGAYADTSGATFAGVLDPTHFRPVASANGTANGDVITMKELVDILGQTPAASDYTDTINYVGAGQF